MGEPKVFLVDKIMALENKLSLRDRQLEVSRKALEEIQKTIEDDRYPVLTTILNHTLSALQAINEMEGKP